MAFDTYDRAIKMKKSFRIEFSLVFGIYKEYTYSATKSHLHIIELNLFLIRIILSLM